MNSSRVDIERDTNAGLRKANRHRKILVAQNVLASDNQIGWWKPDEIGGKREASGSRATWRSQNQDIFSVDRGKGAEPNSA